MEPIIPNQLDKCRGAMVATAIGDALGWPNEKRSENTPKDTRGIDRFVVWNRRAGGRYYSHIEPISAGAYSDDTQLVLSVARSIIAGNWEEFLKNNELPFWLEYERGGGKALLKAAKIYKKGKTVWKSEVAADYFQAGGNGAVMRILPHVIVWENIGGGETLIEDVIKDAIITHGHPRALLGATCYAYALNYLLRKDAVLEFGELIPAVLNGKEVWGNFPATLLAGEWLEAANCQYPYYEEWMRTREDMLRKLSLIETALKRGLLVDDTEILTELHCFDQERGAGDVTILAALYLASKYANNPILGIKVPAFLENADTDTVASVTGGLLGMLCGLQYIPAAWTDVQDYDCLLQITDILASESRPEAVKTFIAKQMTKQVAWVNTSIGKMFQTDRQIIPCGQKMSVELSTWKTSFGQTIYRKKYRKTPVIAESFQQRALLSEARLTDAVKRYLFGMGMEFALLADSSVADVGNRCKCDLLYYHRSLRCLIAVDLKTGSILESDIEWMRKILSSLDTQEKRENENPSIGVIISFCRDKVQLKTISNKPALGAANADRFLDIDDAERGIGKLLLAKSATNDM